MGKMTIETQRKLIETERRIIDSIKKNPPIADYNILYIAVLEDKILEREDWIRNNTNT